MGALLDLRPSCRVPLTHRSTAHLPQVVQYHSDNSNDLNGLTTQTASDLLSDLCDLESTVNYVVFNNAECEGPRATGGNGCFKPVYFQD